MNRRIQPLPSVAAGDGPFRVKHRDIEFGGCCTMPSGETPGLFEAPFVNSDTAAIGVRQHEYGHLAVERNHVLPKNALQKLVRQYLIDEMWAQAGLDVIVNTFMLSRGNREISELPLCKTPSKSVEWPRWMAATLYLRAEALECGCTVRRELAGTNEFDEIELGLLAETGNYLRKGGETGRIYLPRIARQLAILQELFGPYSETGEYSDSKISDPGGHLRRCLLEQRRIKNTWGKIELISPPLTYPYRVARQSLRTRPGFSGAFRYPERALIPLADGRAFACRRRTSGGTVLIDCSGSMSIGIKDLQNILLSEPATTIALYASCPNRFDTGRIVVAAARGRTIELQDAKTLLGPGNVVDGPALEWLNHQPPPRLWISDGFVTGRGDMPAVNLVVDAMRLLRRGHIRCVATVAEYLLELRSRT
jgi:hypothetical protein